MALRGVLRPGYIQIRVTDLDVALKHYVDRVGLQEVSREADGRAYLRAWDEFDRHSVVLRKADMPGMDYVGFKVASEVELDSFARRIEAFGTKTEEVPAGEQPGVGRRLSFLVPTGHRIELFAEMTLSDNGPMTSNPEMWRDEPHGMRVTRFDHCNLHGTNIDGVVKFFVEVLDFSLTEAAETPDGIVTAFRPIRPPGMTNVNMVLVGDSADAADDWIAERIGAAEALNLGAITKQQFLELNRKIGGYDNERAGSTALANSANKPSPVCFTVRPRCSLIFGSTSSPRCAFRRSCVPSSSEPIKRE
jgi:catechol 2,3-dioxygenase-like lactoylglutathione lyase family enzyme